MTLQFNIAEAVLILRALRRFQARVRSEAKGSAGPYDYERAAADAETAASIIRRIEEAA
jgi:hypothetical protein